MKDNIAVVLSWIIIFGVIAIIAIIGLSADYMQCKFKYSDYTNKYELIGGCKVLVNGKFTPVERLRIND